jgi:hypothetical protein
MERGIVYKIFALNSFFKKMIGAKNKEAIKKRKSVKDIESITPESLEDTIKEPATKKVANKTNK